MIKTFYKKRPPKKVFFFKGINVKSYAYGADVHREFVAWRKSFLNKWNSVKDTFWVLENGSIDGNNAKIDRVGELRVLEPGKNLRCLVKKSSELTPIWFDKHCLEVGPYGELIIDGKETEIELGSVIKGWGLDTFWQGTQIKYTLFVMGNDDKGHSSLAAYSLNMDVNKGISVSFVCSVEAEVTLNRKSHIYCFGSHIFLVNDSKLSYYYYNTARSVLEEVAIGFDQPNAGKDFCSNVRGQLVCDADGYVYWHSGNQVCFIRIGYPRRLGMIDLGDSTEILHLQTFRDKLFVYNRSLITRDYNCTAYVVTPSGIKSELFNHGARYNLFYAEKNGLLHYVKIPPVSRIAYVARMNSGNESIISEINTDGATQMFCVNGDLYLNCSYVSAAQKD